MIHVEVMAIDVESLLIRVFCMIDHAWVIAESGTSSQSDDGGPGCFIRTTDQLHIVLALRKQRVRMLDHEDFSDAS